MKKLNLTLKEIQALHQKGELEEAKDAYLEWVKQYPSDAVATHGLGIVFAELGNLDKAEAYVRKAISLNPTDPAFSLHLANILKAKGSFSTAEQVLVDITRMHPRFAAAFNNLGTVYFAQAKWVDAIKCFYHAIEIQSNYVDAYFNLGLALHKANRQKEAIVVYQSLLELVPQHAGGLFQLGSLFMQQDKNEKACHYFLLLLEVYPFHFETRSNLASCYLKMGRLKEAKNHYVKALEIKAQDAQILFNLGVISMQLGELQNAIHYYSQAIESSPDFFEAQNNLGVAFLASRNKEKALRHFREALRIKPHHAPIQHVVCVLMQDKNISTSPAEYIRTLFDSYADHYDAHVMSALHYAVPALFYESVKRNGLTLSEGRIDILDLGCGTGLCGELFKSISQTLIGVDLSEKMLDVARQKQIYDELYCEDLLTFLADHNVSFDLILAGDVFVYIGDLNAVFLNIAKALRQNGLLVFNTEIAHDHDYELTGSGRFSHRIEYIKSLAKQYQLSVVEANIVTLRSEHKEEVKGTVFVLKKGV